ncbi:hypothetical protein [Pseudomonas sp. CH235]|uniref:hypothetical protein n=1 Tax=Pseudomonas sp. CH235 TaxID=1634006 RepID=UPI0010634FAD|nr:hypothetical protein [Pseudomonas sp. CH235]TEA61190.1 hypothetical protein EIY71_14350 [Pseudomonas sp. CH235]
MSYETARDAFIILNIINVAALIIINCIVLYIAKTKIELIMNSLQNSSIAGGLMMLWHGGVRGRIYMMGEIFSFLKRPAIYLYQGKLSAKDIKNFPPDFKRTLLTLYKYQRISGLTFLLFGLLAALEII